MSSRNRITKEDRALFLDLVENHDLSINQAAERVGRTPQALRINFKKAGLEFPKRISKTSLVKANFQRHLDEGLNQREIAEIYNMPASSVSLIAKELNLRVDNARSTSTKEALCKQVEEYMKQNGGTISEVIQKLDLSIVPSTFRKYARRVGFDYKIYRNAYKRYGLWMILPHKAEKRYTCDYTLKALCTGCNQVYDVMATNVRSHQSHGCVNCMRSNKGRYKVECTDTGEVYRSIMSWAKALGRLRQYLTLRKNIHLHGRYEVDGKEYILIEEA